MEKIRYSQAIGMAIADEMRADPTVVAYGEDFTLGYVWPVSRGLIDEFGPQRVLDVPISERLHVGMAVGAAMTGLRPVVEMQFSDFAMLAMDGIINQSAKMRFMSGGQYTVPLVVRLPYGHLRNFAAQHSQSLYSMFSGVPGLQVLAPSTVAEAYSLTRYAIASDVPTLLFEHKSLYGQREELELVRERPDMSVVPLGETYRYGSNPSVVVIATGYMSKIARDAAETMRADGVDALVYSLTNLSTPSFASIGDEIARAGRVLIVDEAAERDPFSGYLASLIYREHGPRLAAPIAELKVPDVPIPFAPALEAAVLPTAERVTAAIRALLAQ
jgi:pyruvate/2-oxoglutarate/acetoin dehydrogenase E1 component